MREAKTKTLISCAVTAQLICVFVFAYANCWFSDAAAQSSFQDLNYPILAMILWNYFRRL